MHAHLAPPLQAQPRKAFAPRQAHRVGEHHHVGRSLFGRSRRDGISGNISSPLTAVVAAYQRLTALDAPLRVQTSVAASSVDFPLRDAVAQAVRTIEAA